MLTTIRSMKQISERGGAGLFSMGGVRGFLCLLAAAKDLQEANAEITALNKESTTYLNEIKRLRRQIHALMLKDGKTEKEVAAFLDDVCME